MLVSPSPLNSLFKMFNCSASFTVAILTITTSINYYLFDLFKFIGLFNQIIRLQFIQEQSRQTLLPGLKLFYECSRFALVFFLAFQKAIVKRRDAALELR